MTTRIRWTIAAAANLIALLFIWHATATAARQDPAPAPRLFVAHATTNSCGYSADFIKDPRSYGCWLIVRSAEGRDYRMSMAPAPPAACE